MKFIIPGTGFVYLNEGAYSTIFVDRESGRVWKVFKNRWDATREHCEAVFNAEVEAYGIARADEDLASLTPDFFGVVDVPKVEDAAREDASDQFHLDLAYQISMVPGYFLKLAETTEFARITALFRAKGILVRDSCVVLDDNGKVTSVIDFTTKEIEPEW